LSLLLEPRIHAHKCSLCSTLAKSRNKVSVIELVLIVFLISICRSVDVFGRSILIGIRTPPRKAMTFPRFLLLSELRTKKMPCRFQQSFVVSNKAFSFPTKLCGFQQTFVVSDKALSFRR
jgi:hypothetical protein